MVYHDYIYSRAGMNCLSLGIFIESFKIQPQSFRRLCSSHGRGPKFLRKLSNFGIDMEKLLHVQVHRVRLAGEHAEVTAP